MKPIIDALHGALFAAALAALIFFLKVICPLNVGCLADPFLVVLFWPLRLFHALGFESISYNNEPIAILLFWFAVGFVIGLILSPFFAKKPDPEIESSKTNY